MICPFLSHPQRTYYLYRGCHRLQSALQFLVSAAVVQFAQFILQSKLQGQQLAENLGLNYHMISTEYRELKRSEGFIRAASHLPDLMEQAALDARSEWADCRACQGIGLRSRCQGRLHPEQAAANDFRGHHPLHSGECDIASIHGKLGERLHGTAAIQSCVSALPRMRRIVTPENNHP